MSSEADFQPITLGELGDFKNGANFSQDDYGAGYPIVNVKQLYGGRYIDLHGLESLGKSVLKRPEQLFLEAGDILFARSSVKRSGAGQCALVPHGVVQTIFSGFIIRYRLADKSATNPMFLAYLLQSPMYREIFPRIATGTTISNLSQDALKQIQVLLPKKQTQDEVASLLGVLDDRITLLRETNATLEAIVQALFKSWFVDFDPVHAKQQGRAPEGMDEATAALFPDSFEESELGLVPKGWQVGNVTDLGEVICGKTPPTSNSKNYGDDVPFITIPDMHGYLVVTATNRALSRLGADSQRKKYLPPGAICVSCIATPGLVVRVTTESQTNQQINSVVPLASWGKSFPLFLLRRIGDAVRAGGSGGSVFHNLSKSGFEELKVLLTSAAIAQKFDEVVEPLVVRIEANQRQAQTLATLRDTLLPRLISGQLRLPDAEAAVEAVL